MPNQDLLFTVVLIVGKDGRRVAKAIERLAEQETGFSECAELLVVRENSGSGFPLCDEALKGLGASAQVVEVETLEYRELWPVAMNHASGRFITFLRGTDQLGPRTLASVRAAVLGSDEHSAPVWMIPAVKNLKSGVRLEGWDQLPDRSASIDLREFPDAAPVSLSGLFFETSSTRAHEVSVAAQPDESLHVAELIRGFGSRFEFVSEPGVAIACAGRGLQKLDPEAEHERLIRTVDYFESLPVDRMDRATNSTMLFLLRERLSVLDDARFADGGAEREFKQRLRALVDRVPTSELHASPWLRELPFRYLVDSAAFLNMPWTIGENGEVHSRDTAVFSVSEFPIEVMRLNPKRDELEIEAIFQNHFAGELDIVLVSGSGEIVRAVEATSGGEGPTRLVAGRVTSLVHYRRFLVPAKPTTNWRFAFVSPHFTGHVFAGKLSHHAKVVFSRDPERRRQFGPGYAIDFMPEGGYTLRSGGEGRLAYKLRRAREYRREFGKFPWSMLTSGGRKKLILINDRAKYGNDNGEAIFRYIQEHRPELRKQTWFVLDETAPSYEELVKTGRVVRPRTFKHRALYLNTRLHFSSHVPATYNSPWHGNETSFLSDFFDPTFIWIRHGVTMNRVDKVYNRFNANLDGIVASAGYEKDYLEREGSFFTENSVVASGLPRFDRLSDTSRSQEQRSLLYMPTWRNWLAGPAQADGSRRKVDGFEESDYFLQQRRLMTDPEILAALEAANAHFEFLIHPVMASYQEHYNELASDRVTILDQSSISYSDLFARGAAMITDYSSVFVDFSYLRKPVLFDQSDEGRFRAGHYTAGLFDYETQAPGPVLRNFESLKQATLRLIQSGFTVAPEYAGRLDDFFLYDDRLNSKRALEAGIRIDERRRGESFPA